MIKNTFLSLFLMVSLLLSACQNEAQPEKIEKKDPEIILDLRNPKIEVSTQFEEMTRAYERENPNVNIRVHTVGGAMDDLADLKAEMATGTGPDIFTNTGFENTILWQNFLEDLSGEPWVDQAYQEALTPVTLNGKVFGMPINLEGYGFIYNKDLFKKAGIAEPPDTLTKLTAAAEKLQKAGITPFATGYYEDWKLGDHLMNVAFAQQENTEEFIQNLNKGTEKITTNQNFNDLLNLLDLTLKFGNDNPLTTDYTMEVNLFTSGKAAIIQQGNWIQPMIDQAAPDMNIGFMPIPINDRPVKEALVVSVPNYWAVNKQASPEKKKEAKKFLNWMVSSEQGKRYMTEEFKFIPAFHHINSDDLGPLAEETIQNYKKGNTVPSNWFDFPVGIREEFGAATQLYVGKQLNRTQLLNEYQKSWERFSKE
ncbi:ABC transporter substrate-binding protein [Bacillus sp. CMF21]|uniref:ABC transporter substrate-binding protein n=1 Tax=Metabacillus dongyingensis TaxID=2874282 RepID=UPI001CBBFDB7|nr:ABC transporter substrate-binding protein [Metabacillus dongyingensis]UAL52581.1 ABC transporter substrate-binding protein [Metabacillus dongyingensis]USK28898.1 ABC transporter substrate-binding protein [Bacillus sp. CMF21]